MTHNWPDTFFCLLILLVVTIVTGAGLHIQQEPSYLPDAKFPYKEYAEYSDVNEQDQTEHNAPWQKLMVPLGQSRSDSSDHPSTFDPNIKWDKTWDKKKNFGQLSAVDLDPNGNIILFSRRERTWNYGSFDLNNIFDKSKGPIKQNTIIHFDKNGKVLFEWGKNMFYMPHGLTIDSLGNYWLTDVAMHQVFKFDRDQVEKLRLNTQEPSSTSIITPSLVLGKAFSPGRDSDTFCKPTAVAVAKNGDFFVSDGYCNSRIIKFNADGRRILTIGREVNFPTDILSPYALFVPHALAIAHELDLIFVADREHGRVLSFSIVNGTFQKEYRHPTIGRRVYSVDYTQGRIYLVNGGAAHVHGFTMDVETGNIISEFGPDKDMVAPHDIAVSDDGTEIYVPELELPLIYKFLQENSSKTLEVNTKSTGDRVDQSHHDINLQNNFIKNSDKPKPLSTSIIILVSVISAIVLIFFCTATAAVVARCQKRGCLFLHRRGYWSNDRKDNFKLSNLLDVRQGKNFRIFDNRPNTRDFSKLNTEPETSEDEHIEDSLII